jgi:hypothetical protein
MRIIISLFFVLSFLNVTAQQYPLKASKVPPLVKSSFAKHYPKVEMAAWMMEGLNYLAIFKSEGKSLNVCFDAKGTLIYNYFPIERNTIPAKVWKTASKQKVDKYEPDNFGKGISSDLDSVYFIGGSKEKEKIFLFIDENGKLKNKFILTVD